MQQRPPLSLYLLSVSASIHGLWLAMNGLALRVSGGFFPPLGPLAALGRPDGLAANLWQQSQPLGSDQLGWLLVVLGTTWAGVLVSLWLRFRWGYRSAWLLGLFSLAFFGTGTVLGLITLVCLALPATRRWAESGA